MATDRLGILKQMVAQDANNSFARYGLGMEYVKTGEFEQAVAEFRALLARDNNYSAAYFHGGQALEKLGRIQEARVMYEQGIEAAIRIGDAHTRAEIEGALNLLSV